MPPCAPPVALAWRRSISRFSRTTARLPCNRGTEGIPRPAVPLLKPILEVEEHAGLNSFAAQPALHRLKAGLRTREVRGHPAPPGGVVQKPICAFPGPFSQTCFFKFRS